MRKGQAAMEFLMTYGWAILVVLAAIGALAYFGVLSPDRFLPSKCTISGGFSCTEYKISSQGPIIKVQNNVGLDVTLANITLIHRSGMSGQSWVTPATAVLNGDSVVMACATCGYSGPAGVVNYNYTGAAVSGKYRGTAMVWYSKSGETVMHVSSGDVSGNVET